MDAEVRSPFQFKLKRNNCQALVAAQINIQSSKNGEWGDITAPIHLVNYLDDDEVSRQITDVRGLKAYKLIVRLEATEVRDLGGAYDFELSVGDTVLRAEEGNVDEDPNTLEVRGRTYFGILLVRN